MSSEMQSRTFAETRNDFSKLFICRTENIPIECITK